MSAQKAAGSWEIGVDIGGTFTDLVAIRTGNGERVDVKVLTTPTNPLDGVLNAIAAVGERGVDVKDSSYVVHATTLAINTLVERTGARIGMITTPGFRDVIEIGREARYDLYDLQLELHDPLVSRELRLEVDERLDHRGTVVVPLDRDAVVAAVDAMGPVDAVVVAFLHSYANDSHEREAAAIVSEKKPEAYVSTSADVAPIRREYERFIATAINAYVGPRVSYYINALDRDLTARGFTGEIGIMKSDGGMCSPAQASRHPVRILESGPAAGILSAAHTAVQCNEALAVAFDMGGTTAKACLVQDGHATKTDELDVARLKRYAAGSGLPVCIPSLDLVEVGAGGGSIAWIDELGILQVGPQSSGAEPGPACYQGGGTEPTVTDADLLLGYLDPDYFAGGTIQLDAELSRAAVTEHLLERTGTQDVTLAAWAIHDIVNENMARAARLHCLEHGIDPADVSLVATGGAGPVHATWIMEKLGAQKVICPPSGGVASALGLLLAPRTVEVNVTDILSLDEVTDEVLQERLAELEAQLRREYPDEGYDVAAWVHMRLIGQGYELRADVPASRTVEGLQEVFNREYAARFGRNPWSGDREIVDWGVQLVRPRSIVTAVEQGEESRAAASRRAYFSPAYGWVDTPVLSRDALREGSRSGPMLIAEDGTTIVIGPGQVAHLDSFGNVHIAKADADSDLRAEGEMAESAV